LTDPQIPIADTVIGAANQWLATNRPESIPHLGIGNWANLLLGWRAQAATNIARVASEVNASRLPFSSGSDLLDLAGSEFDTFFSSTPLVSKGTVTLTRGHGQPGAGIIRSGFRFHRIASTQSNPQLKDAVYTATQDIPVPGNATVVTVPVAATSAGSYANLPNGSIGSNVVFGDVIFDSNFSITSIFAAGGTDGISDPIVRAACKSFATGRYGPTLNAISAGVLRTAGAASYQVVEDTTLAATFVLPVDATWAQSPALDKAVFDTLLDAQNTPGFLGFGCRIFVGSLDPNYQIAFSNVFISVTATVTLRSSDFLSSTPSIDANVKAACTDYFNNRPDWNVFKVSNLQGRIANCDRRILSCTAVTVSNLTNGATVSEPSGIWTSPTPGNPTTLSHFFLDGTNVSTTYVSPA
jgi:hypothetical protein